MTEPYPLHVGDMALELAEREFHSTPPLELLQLASEDRGTTLRFGDVLDIARGVIDEKWTLRATEDPTAVQREYEMTIGLDGFPGTEEVQQ